MENGAPQETQERTEDHPAEPVSLHESESRRGNKPLPTNRIAFNKQFDLLRAFDAASNGGMNPVTLKDVAKVASMAETTISLSNPFFVDVGLLQKSESGKFTPSPAVHEFALAHAWGPDTAAEKLAPILRESWFYKALEPQLKYQSSTPERQAMELMSQAAGGISPDYRPQLLLLLGYLDTAGLIQQDGTVIRAVRQTEAPPASDAIPPGSPRDRDTKGEPSQAKDTGPSVATSFSHQPEGMLQFAFSIRVSMAELQGWSPDRIAALFKGVADVLAAKGDVEVESLDPPA